MSIEVLQKELDQTSNTLGVVILSLSEAEAALNEINRMRDALRQYAIRENWQCGKTQRRDTWNRDYEHGYKLAEEALGEGRIWPATTA